MDDILNIRSNFDEDKSFEKIRPATFSDFIGQNDIVEHLGIAIQSAKERGESLDHILLYGPPGLGKTTLSHIIACELGVSFHTTTGPTLERKKDIAAIIMNMGDKDILFIDEIHRLNRSIEETLYPAMEDFVLDIILGQGPSAKTVRLDLPRFTLIGATTRAGMLTSPLRDRFGIIQRIAFYENDDLEKIIQRAARVFSIEIDPVSSHEIAKRSRGTPRISIRILKRIRDYAVVKSNGTVNPNITGEALENLKIDNYGLDDFDKRLLITIIEKYQGGPVGIDNLAIALSEAKETIEDIYEPYLIQVGFIKRTQRGRVATRLAYDYLGIKKDDTPTLF